MLDRLYHIVKETEARIVLSSSWRNAVKSRELDGLWLERKFRQKGMSFYSFTGYSNHSRGKEILNWLEEHKDMNIEQYAILDDEFVRLFNDIEFEDEKLIEHLIHTDSTYGLTKELADRTIELLNGKLITQEEYQPWVDEWNGLDVHIGKEL